VRQDVAFACQQFPMSERRACKLLTMDRSTYRYEPRPDHNADLRQKLMNWPDRNRATATAACTFCWNGREKRIARCGCSGCISKPDWPSGG